MSLPLGMNAPLAPAHLGDGHGQQGDVGLGERGAQRVLPRRRERRAQQQGLRRRERGLEVRGLGVSERDAQQLGPRVLDCRAQELGLGLGDGDLPELDLVVGDGQGQAGGHQQGEHHLDTELRVIIASVAILL